MRNMKKVLSTFVISLICICAVSTVVFASSFTSEITTDKKEIRGGDEVELTLSFNNFKDIKKGINSFKGKLDYDTNIFEKVTIYNMEALNRWENLLFNEKINEFVAIHKAGSNEKEDVLKFRLKVKDGVLAAKTSIKIENLVASDGKKDINAEDLSIELDVIENQDGKPTENQQNNNSQSPSGNTTSNNAQSSGGNKTSNNNQLVSKNESNKTSSENLNSDVNKEEVSSGEKPSTNDEKIKIEEEKKSDKDLMVVKKSIWSTLRSLLLIILIIILIILFIIWKNKKDEDKEGKTLTENSKRFMLIFLVASITVLQLSSTVYGMVNKGELNGDNAVDYLDVTLLQQHLIKLKLLPEEFKERADMNNDGMLTVTDLSFIIQKIENDLDYDVEISSAMDSYYIEKGNIVNIKFNAYVSHGAKITEITLNGEKHLVKELGNNEYSVEIPAYDKAGIYDFNITSVKLDVGKEIKTSFNEKIEVLKDSPIIKDYEVKDLINEGKVQISFNVEDIDAAITSGYIKVIAEDNGELIRENITSGNNTFDVKVEEGKDYKAIIELSYNRDTDKLEHEMDNSGTSIVEKDIKLIIDYQLTLSNISTYDNENNKSTIFSKGQEIIIGFESQNATTFTPENVVINGVSYPVEKKDELYIVKLEAFKEFGEKEIKIEEIQLSNGKKLEVKENNTVKVTISKNAPSISDVVMEEDVEADKMNISFKVNDEDSALKNLKMVLSDASGNIIFEEAISEAEYSKEVQLGNKLTNSYTLKIIGDYDLSLGNGQEVINKELYTEVKEAKARAIVEDSSISEKYLEKGGDLELKYTIKTNKQEKIKKIIVSNVEVPVTEESSGKYKTTIQVGRNAGKQDVTLTKVIFEDDTVAKVNKVDAIEILKDKPKANNFKSVDDYNKLQMIFSFNIEDIDNSFISGKAQLFKKDGSLVSEKDITASGDNEYAFDVVEQEEYDFKVIATYKRDEDATKVIYDEELLNKDVQLVIDYNLNVSNLETYNMSDNKTSYIDRNTDIKLRFTSTNNTNFIPEKVVVNSTEYSVKSIGNNIYEVVLSGFDSAGVKEIKIEKIILNNTKELEVNQNNKVNVEVLKLKPTYKEFKYEELDTGDIRIYFNLVDDEKSIKSSKLMVNDGTSDIFTKENLTIGENKIDFKPNHNEKYTVKVIANYDLDTNTLDQNTNEVTDEVILEEEIVFNQELIQMKDISEVVLYRKNNNNVEAVKELNIQSFNPKDYIVKVIMKDMTNFYSEVKNGSVVKDNFILELDYDNVVQYDGDIKSNTITVNFGKVENNIVKRVYFEDVINTIKNNPTAEISLTQDLDATDVISKDSVMIVTEFRGKINGNGYKIKNLNKPLFDMITGATIENLIIDGATVNNSNGILSNTISRGKISNVHIRNSSITANHNNGTGAFAGTIDSDTVIEESSVLSSTIRGSKRTGGFSGYAKNNSIIRNSYIKDSIVNSSWDAAGGIVGELVGRNTVENSYAKIQFNVNGDHAHGGIFGYATGNNAILNNVISLADGDKGKRVAGNNSTKSTNTFEISESRLVSNANINGIDEISKNNINDEFLKNKLKWDSTIWNISNNNFENMPILKNELGEEVVEADNKDVYIPDIKRLKKLDNYEIAKEIAYHNMYILMPFYDAKLYVDYGNKISNDHILNITKIKTVIPYDANGKMIVGLNSNNYNSISKIKLVFENDQIEEYALTFNKKLGDVGTYKIDSLGIGYTYNKFILNTSISLVNDLITAAEAMDYKTVIAAVTPEEESRLYVDYYNESVKPRLREVVINILQSEPEYNIYIDNEILKEKIKNDLLVDNELAKALYAYNYYDKWYNFKLGEVPLSDAIFFSASNMVNKDYDVKIIVKDVIEQSETLRKTEKTIDFYNSVIKPKANNLEIKEFLEYYIKILAGENSGEDWFANNFKGILEEKPIIGKETEVDYRAWTLLNKRNHLLLPILSAPLKDMYIISMPTQLAIGSLNRYTDYLNNNMVAINEVVNEYSNKISNFYNTSASFIENSADILNSRTHIQYDTRFYFPNTGTQEKGTTQDPVIKWVYEAVNVFQPGNGSGAFANGTDIFWVVDAALSRGERAMHVFSHETAHNQDGYYFYELYGRRYETGPEDHADGNIAQDLGDGSLQFNLSKDFSLDDNISTNLTLDRINGKDNVYSYYKEMFETYYVLDYLTAQAFLKLSPEEQSKLATQANDTPGNTDYKSLTADEFKNMDLKSMDDLWDNKIVFRSAGNVGGGTYGSYGGDNHYNIYWYQPHNDQGRPDSYSFKRLGFEMLGVGGYTDGYVAYRSRKSGNDLEALRIATGMPNITWKEYKLGRYDNVEKNLKNISYFDADKVIELYKEALIKDAAVGNRNETNNVRRILYGFIKRVTNDFTDATIYDAKNVKEIFTAEELIQAISTNSIGNYKIVKDLDFSKIDVSNQEAYVMNKFYGMIDGNGHKFNGLTKPLIKNISYSHIKNLTIESPIYTGDVKASLIIEAKNSMIGDIKVINSNIKIPFVKDIVGTFKEYGDMQNVVQENTISSVDDLKRISDDTTGLARKLKYKLTSDIDVSSITSQNFIITGEFAGEINGNGYKIYNQSKPLIENLTGSVMNLKFESAIIGTNQTNNIGVLAGNANSATIENISLNNITVRGRDNVSALIGQTRDSNINKVTANKINVTGTNFYAGGLIGRAFSTNVSNVVVSGELTITKTHNGGIIGAMNNGSIENAYGNMKINRPSNGDNRDQNGGLVGTLENRKGTIRNSVSVEDVNSDVYKVIAAKNAGNLEDIKNNLQNVYEIEETTGLSSANTEGNVTSIKRDKLKELNFYTDTLKWDDSIWDFTEVTNGGLPKLK